MRYYFFLTLLICMVTGCTTGGQQRNYIISQSQVEETKTPDQEQQNTP